MCPQKDLYRSVRGSLIYNSHNWKQPRCPSAGEYINTLEYSFNAISFKKEQEHITNTCNDMGDSQIHYFEYKKPYLKVCALYNYSQEILEQTNPPYSRGKIRAVPASWGMEVRIYWEEAKGVLSGGNGNILVTFWGTQMYIFVKTQRMYLRPVHFIYTYILQSKQKL